MLFKCFFKSPWDLLGAIFCSFSFLLSLLWHSPFCSHYFALSLALSLFCSLSCTLTLSRSLLHSHSFALSLFCFLFFAFYLVLSFVLFFVLPLCSLSCSLSSVCLTSFSFEGVPNCTQLLLRYQKDISAWNVKVQKMGYAEKISALQEMVTMLKKKSKEWMWMI